MWSKLLRRLETDLAARGILDAYPRQQGLQWSPFDPDAQAPPMDPFLGPTWMDDLCLCVAADTNEELIQNLGFAAGVLIDPCHSYRLEPNFAERQDGSHANFEDMDPAL